MLCFSVPRFIPAESTCVSFWSTQCDLCESCPVHQVPVFPFPCCCVSVSCARDCVFLTRDMACTTAQEISRVHLIPPKRKEEKQKKRKTTKQKEQKHKKHKKHKMHKKPKKKKKRKKRKKKKRKKRKKGKRKKRKKKKKTKKKFLFGRDRVEMRPHEFRVSVFEKRAFLGGISKGLEKFRTECLGFMVQRGVRRVGSAHGLT